MIFRASGFEGAEVGRAAGEAVRDRGKHRAGIHRRRAGPQTEIQPFRYVNTLRITAIWRSNILELQAHQRQSLPPLGFAGFAVLHLDLGIAVVIAADAKIETE